MPEKLFKNKQEFERWVKQHSILDSTKFKTETTFEDFMKFMEETYDLMLKKDDSFLYSLDKLQGKIALRKLLMDLDRKKVG